MLMNRHHPKRAFSLMEIAIVLMVIGLVLSALWLAAAQVWEYTRREQAREDITTTVANMRSYYGGQAGVTATDFASLTNQLLAANVIPSSLKRVDGCGADSCADHPWGQSSGGTLDPSGTFRVCNWIIGAAESTSCTGARGAISAFFGISLTGLTRKSCIAVVSSMSSATEPTGLVEINIDGANLLAAGNSIQPVSDTVETADCVTSGSPDTGTNVVTFVYRVIAPQP